MTARRRLAQLTELQRLQRAERDIAALDHAEATRTVEAARAEVERATARCTAAAEAWYQLRVDGHFRPEIDLLASARLIAAETLVVDRTSDARRAEGGQALSEARWHLAEAHDRATGRVVRDARREVGRVADEARLDMVAGRALARWRKR